MVCVAAALRLRCVALQLRCGCVAAGMRLNCIPTKHVFLQNYSVCVSGVVNSPNRACSKGFSRVIKGDGADPGVDHP